MNNDLISRSALKEVLNEKFKNSRSLGFHTFCLICDVIDNAPSTSFVISPDYVTELQNRNKELIKQLEEAERPQGEWRLDMLGPYCSECGVYPDYSSNFCPNCGASMKGCAEE